MNENKQIYALPLGQTDIRIECEGTSTEITGWAITDNNGDRYIYRQREPVFFHIMEHRLIFIIMAMRHLNSGITFRQGV